MKTRLPCIMILLSIVSACGKQENLATSAPKPTDGWAMETTESSMDGKKVVASKKFSRVSADNVTKSTIKVALTCAVATKSLSITMRAVDYDKQLQSEVPTQFDSEFDNLKSIPVGRIKSKGSKPFAVAEFFALKQDDFLIWDVSNLTSEASPVMAFLGAGGEDAESLKAKNQMLLTAAGVVGIPNAGSYADLNSMFSAERPWTIEISAGRDPFEIVFPADSDSLNGVLRACGAYPPVLLQKTEAQKPEAGTTTASVLPVPSVVPVDQEPSPSAANVRDAVGQPDIQQTTTSATKPTTANESVPPSDTSRSASTSKPSFDCAKASTQVEKLICSSPTLSQTDSEMAAEYKKMYNTPGADVNAIKQAQRDFIAKRNQCTSVDCIADAYRARRTVLAQLGAQD